MRAAAKALHLRQTRPLREISSSSPGRPTTFSRGGFAIRPIPAQLVYLRARNGALRLAWHVQIFAKGGGHWWDVSVDVSTLRLLAKHDLFEHADESYRVFAAPAENPDVAGRTLVTNPADATASPFGWLDTDGVAGADTTVTDGNNAHVAVDVNPRDGVADAGSEADGGAGLSFDFPLDLTQDLDAQAPAAVTNMFYWANHIHDVTASYGFTEAAGNFQQTNYSGQGQGGDSVQILDRAFNFANSSMATSTDGSAPVMRMGNLEAAKPSSTTLHVTAPAEIAGDLAATTAAYGPDTSGGDISGQVMVGPEALLCTTPGSQIFAGMIAYADRGTCSFKTKTLNAQLAGATALIIGQNSPLPPAPMGNDPTISTPITIPTVMISQTDAASIKAQIASQVEVDATISIALVPARDWAFDNGIVAHEYMHGITNRLVGGGAGCAGSAESPNEGWSDFLGLVLTARASDTATTSRPEGAWALNFANGERPTPYSTDFAVDPAVYDRIKSDPETHGIGYVWTSMLWDMYWNLVNAHGYAPIQDHDLTSGNGLALQLVLDGEKLTPCSPGFVDARDAILQADQADTGGQNQCPIWRAFAGRGLGTGASQGSSDDAGDGIQSFDVPAGCAPSVSFATTPATATGDGGTWFNASDLGGPGGTLARDRDGDRRPGRHRRLDQLRHRRRRSRPARRRHLHREPRRRGAHGRLHRHRRRPGDDARACDRDLQHRHDRSHGRVQRLPVRVRALRRERHRPLAGQRRHLRRAGDPIRAPPPSQRRRWADTRSAPGASPTLPGTPPPPAAATR